MSRNVIVFRGAGVGRGIHPYCVTLLAMKY